MQFKIISSMTENFSLLWVSYTDAQTDTNIFRVSLHNIMNMKIVAIKKR